MYNMQIHEATQEQQPSAYLQSILDLAERAAATSRDMNVAEELDLNQLCAMRSELDKKIQERRRADALQKGLKPITQVDIRGVLQVIFLSDLGDTKRGMVQRCAGDKSEEYRRILNFRVTDEIVQLIPKREELVQVFGNDVSMLAAPIGSKINQIIPRVRCLLEVATEVLDLRAALKEAEAEIHDCHDQIEFALGFSGPIKTKSTRGRKSKLSECEAQEVAFMKQQGLSNQAVLEQINAIRAEFGESPVGLTTIKSVPALVAKQRISDQITEPEPKALSGIGRGACVHISISQSDSNAIIVPNLIETDCLAIAEVAAIREVWGVDEGRGIGFDMIGRCRPSRRVQMYEKQFAAWKEGLNI